MTVTNNINRSVHTGDGTTTVFMHDGFYLNADELAVKVSVDGVDTDLVNGTDFTAEPGGNPAGGMVTFTDPPADEAIVAIFNVPEITQTTDYAEGGSFGAETHERALDNIVLICQRLNDLISRSFVISETSNTQLTAEAVQDVSEVMDQIENLAAIVPAIQSLAGISTEIANVAAIEGDVSELGSGYSALEAQIDAMPTYTISTSVPSGAGEDGDIHIQYTP